MNFYCPRTDAACQAAPMPAAKADCGCRMQQPACPMPMPVAKADCGCRMQQPVCPMPMPAAPVTVAPMVTAPMPVMPMGSQAASPCGCHGTSQPNPYEACLCNMSLAMSYVLMQTWSQTYEPAVALRQGTIFPELDLPFLAAGRNC